MYIQKGGIIRNVYTKIYHISILTQVHNFQQNIITIKKTCQNKDLTFYFLSKRRRDVIFFRVKEIFIYHKILKKTHDI